MEMFASLGISERDIDMLLLCPLFAAIGGLIHSLRIYNDFSCPPKLPKIKETSFDRTLKQILVRIVEKLYMAIVRWAKSFIHHSFVINKLLYSALTGLVVSIYFIGIYPDELHGLARIWILCLLAGYGSHLVWKAEEKWARSLLESVVKQQLRNERSEKDDKDS